MHRDLCDRGSQIQIRILSKERTLTCMNNPIGKFFLNLLVLVLYQEKIHRLKAIVNVAKRTFQRWRGCLMTHDKFDSSFVIQKEVWKL